MITIDENICTQCNTCYQHYPHGVIVVILGVVVFGVGPKQVDLGQICAAKM